MKKKKEYSVWREGEKNADHGERLRAVDKGKRIRKEGERYRGRKKNMEYGERETY